MVTGESEVDEAEPPEHRSRHRWVMLAAVWFGYACFGLVTASLAPLITPIRESLDLSRSAMGVILGGWALVYIVAAVPAGFVLDRFGTKVGLGIGMLLIAVSGLARAVAVDFWTLFLAVGAFGLGGPLLSVGAPKMLSQWFGQRERGLAMGVYLTGPAVGSVLALTTANRVLMPAFDGSWRWTLASFASVALLAAAVWTVVARDPAGATDAATTGGSKLSTYVELVRHRPVQIVLGMALGSFFVSHATNNWLPEIIQDRGASASTAGTLAAIPVVVGVVGTLTVPRFATEGRRLQVLVVLFLTVSVSAMLIGAGTGLSLTLYAGLVLLGLARTIIVPTMLVLMDMPNVNAANMGAAGGLFFTFGEIGGVTGPTTVGILADRSGDYGSSLALLAGLGVALTAATLLLQRTMGKAGRPDRQPAVARPAREPVDDVAVAGPGRAPR